jgi:RHH-type rel operon transcriptional repressor/antitoxin RelB
MPAISIRLSDDLSKRLQKLAKRTGRTKSFYVVKAIQEHLQDLEDIYIAEERLIALREGRSRTYTLEEVERELGLGHPTFSGHRSITNHQNT